MSKNRFVFEYRHRKGPNVSVSTHGDGNINTVFEAFEVFLTASGFSQKTIDVAFKAHGEHQS